MKNLKTREQVQNENKLLKFYNDKAREQRGGKFFAVFRDGVSQGTVWGRILVEAIQALNEAQLHNRKFTSFGRPFPGNIQFTRVVRLF
jgi:hypothetical protein